MTVTLNPPYPVTPIDPSEHGTNNGEDHRCICGEQQEPFLVADRSGRLVDVRGGTTQLPGLSPWPTKPEVLVIHGNCGRVYDDIDLARTDGISPILARIDITTPAWDAAVAMYYAAAEAGARVLHGEED